MRPLIVDLGREYRGGQHQALLLLEGLRKRGHSPELIAICDSLLAIRAKETGAPVHEVGTRWRRLAAAARIRGLVRERRVDVLHANEPHALTSAWLAQAHRNMPVVVSRRIALPLSRGSLSFARYRAASRVIAVSQFVAQSVVQSRLAAARVAVVYDGVKIPPEKSEPEREASRRKLGIPPDAICIGNVAAYVPEKGHALLLEAFASLHSRFPRCVLILRGEGPEQCNLQSSASRLQIADGTKFLPLETTIETMFAAMDIFAFPSHEEPLGSALLAAMARGLPCVAVARGGVPEVMTDGQNGLLVKSLEPQPFAEAIARLIAHREEATRLGAAARRTIADRFSAHQMVEETLRLYEGVLTGDS